MKRLQGNKVSKYWWNWWWCCMLIYVPCSFTDKLLHLSIRSPCEKYTVLTCYTPMNFDKVLLKQFLKWNLRYFTMQFVLLRQTWLLVGVLVKSLLGSTLVRRLLVCRKIGRTSDTLNATTCPGSVARCISRY